MGSPEMLFLSDDAIAGALDYPGLVAELDLAFQDLAQEQAVIHARQRSRVGDARLNTMGGIWKRRGVAAVNRPNSPAARGASRARRAGIDSCGGMHARLRARGVSRSVAAAIGACR